MFAIRHFLEHSKCTNAKRVAHQLQDNICSMLFRVCSNNAWQSLQQQALCAKRSAARPKAQASRLLVCDWCSAQTRNENDNKPASCLRYLCTIYCYYCPVVRCQFVRAAFRSSEAAEQQRNAMLMMLLYSLERSASRASWSQCPFYVCSLLFLCFSLRKSQPSSPFCFHIKVFIRL